MNDRGAQSADKGEIDGRSPHYLRPSRACGFPRQHIAVVVHSTHEGTVSTLNVRAVQFLSWEAVSWIDENGSIMCGSVTTGTNPDTLWKYVEGVLQRQRTTWLWMLGAVQACTLSALWEKLTSGEWVVCGFDPTTQAVESARQSAASSGICIIEDPPTIILCKPSHRSGSVKILDVRNLGVDSWESMQSEQDDCVGMMRWLQSWIATIRELDLGGLRHTAAAQAWHGWRYRHLNEGVLVHGNLDAITIERSALYSGRAEAYRIGRVEGPIYQIDASAHYPALSVAGQMPCRLKWCGSGDDRLLRNAESRGWLAIAECDVTTGIPCAPCRIRDATIFPVGKWRAALCGPEIELVRKCGGSVDVRKVCLYEPGEPWHSYMHAMWRSRNDLSAVGAVGAAQCVKRLMNSCIGKTAAIGWGWIPDSRGAAPADWSTWYATDYDTGNPCRYRSIGWHVQREQRLGEHPESCPALAAWVYSLGRVKLWEWIQCAGKENVYYVDTDSLFTNREGFQRLSDSCGMDSGVCGALRLQGVHERVTIDGIKAYVAGSHSTRSGLPARAELDQKGDGCYWSSETIKDTIRGGRAPLSQERRYRVPRERVYRHGIVCPDGAVIPIRVEEF